MVINPASGKDEPVLNVLNDVFHQHEDIEWTISVTKKYSDATAQAREAAEGRADLVAGYGGDGTQHEIANGILGTTAVMGVLPGGTGNGFTTELGTPKELRHRSVKWANAYPRLISAVAIVSGLLVVVRYYLNAVFGLQFVAESVASIVLGAVVLLTGVSHLITEWNFGYISGRRILHYLLALFEILLGLQLMLLSLVDHLFVRQTIIVWALIGGILFVSTTIYDHFQHRQADPTATMDSPHGGSEQVGTLAVNQEEMQQSAALPPNT